MEAIRGFIESVDAPCCGKTDKKQKRKPKTKALVFMLY